MREIPKNVRPGRSAGAGVSYTGTSGIMSADEVLGIRKILDEIDPDGSRLLPSGADDIESDRIERTIAIGVLCSSKSLRGEPTRWKNRYAEQSAWKGIVDACDADADARLTSFLHISSSALHKTVGEDPDIERAFEAAEPHLQQFDGFQINSAWPQASFVSRAATFSRSRGMYFILQIPARAIEECRAESDAGTARNVAERLCLYFRGNLKRPFSHVLIDPSCGTGKDLDVGLTEAIVKALTQALAGTGVEIGIAGGLSAETLPHVKPLLTRYPDLSTDAEGKLRDGSELGGHLVLDKVRQYLDAALPRF